MCVFISFIEVSSWIFDQGKGSEFVHSHYFGCWLLKRTSREKRLANCRVALVGGATFDEAFDQTGQGCWRTSRFYFWLMQSVIYVINRVWSVDQAVTLLSLLNGVCYAVRCMVACRSATSRSRMWQLKSSTSDHLLVPVALVHGPDLQNILRQSYDNAKVTIDLRRTSNLQNILRRAQGFSWVRFTCIVVRYLRQCSQISLRYS